MMATKFFMLTVIDDYMQNTGNISDVLHRRYSCSDLRNSKPRTKMLIMKNFGKVVHGFDSGCGTLKT